MTHFLHSRCLSVAFLILVQLASTTCFSQPTGTEASPPKRKTGVTNPPTGTTKSIDERITLAIDWLLDFNIQERKFNASAGNDLSKTKVALLQTAFLLEICPEAFSDDPRRQQVLEKAEAFLAQGFDSVSVFESWVAGFAGLYIFEKSVREKQLHPSLKMLGESWVNRQNGEGAWSHGTTSRMVDFYPSTVLAAANFGLIGLGAIKELNHPYQNSIDYKDVVDEAIATYTKIQSLHGGFPYGARSYQKAVQSGRTATSLIGLAALELADSDLFCRAAHFSVTNVETVPFGHASPAMHMGCGGLAFAMLGGAPWQKFKKAHFEMLAKNQRDDGSFSDFNNSPDSSIGDQEVSTAYITALYTICLAADRSKFIRQLGEKFDTDNVLAKGRRLVHGSEAAEIVPSQRLVNLPSSIELNAEERPLFICKFAERLAVAIVSKDRRTVRWAGIRTGKTVAKIPLQQPLAEQDLFRLRGDRLLVVSYPVPGSGAVSAAAADQPNGQSATASSETQAGADLLTLRCYQISTGKLIWDQSVPSLSRLHAREHSVDLLSSAGTKLRRFDLATGKLVFEADVNGSGLNFGLNGVDGGPCFVSWMGNLTKYDHRGNKVWNKRLKGQRGMVQPNPTTLVVHDGLVFLTTAYSQLVCHDAENGRRLWLSETGTNSRLKLDHQKRLFVLSDDGLLRRVSLERKLPDTEPRYEWTTRVGSGREKIVEAEANSRDYQLNVMDDCLVVRDAANQQVTVVDPDSGQILLETSGDDMLAHEDIMMVVRDGQLLLWRMESK